MKKIAIIGAGASGIICAIFCARAKCKVEIFEQNEKCAKKILVSGNGRCNISNKNLSINDYFSNTPFFVEEALKSFGFKEFEKFASEIGILLETKDDGRVYPLSNEAKGVASILLHYAQSLGVVIHTNTKITDIQKDFSLISDNKTFNGYSAVVVATGSKAASHLGGNDDGHIFAKKFSHSIIPTYPSLVQFHLDSTLHTKMSGAKLNAQVTLLINNKVDSTCEGDVLFTKYGVSGFAILDLSQRASVALMNYERVGISINLLPNFNAQKLSAHLLKTAQNMPEFLLLDILSGLVPVKIAQGLLQDLDISNDAKANQLHTKLSKKISNTMLNWRFAVKDTHGFRHAEVSGGGVDASEINPKTMESLKQKNLYFCGEVLDVLGRRGGFNFAFAWASGYLASKNITRNKQ